MLSTSSTWICCFEFFVWLHLNVLWFSTLRERRRFKMTARTTPNDLYTRMVAFAFDAPSVLERRSTTA